MMALKLDDLYRGRRVPPWLRRFEDEPVEALHDLLLGRAWLGHLNAAEPETVLRDWMEGLGKPLVESVDAALAAWIERYWGTPVLPRSADSAEVSAEAWRRAFDLLSVEPRMREAPGVLRRFLPDRRAFLGAMREGRSRDPEGRAWLALARHQDDRELIHLWWWLCDLPPDVPWYQGRYGVHGLRNLPEKRPGAGGGFPSEVAEGLVRFGNALEGRVGDGWLAEASARDEFLRVARTTMWAYNFHDRWLPFWRQMLSQEDRIVDRWVRELFPEKLKHAQFDLSSGKQQHLQPDPEWRDLIPKIRRALSQPTETTVADARRLLRSQQGYAEATGDTEFVVKTAVNFAGRVRKKKPELALEWTHLARRFDPDNAHAWTTEAAVLLDLGRLGEARRIAFEAVRRFPYNDVAHNTLAEVFKAQGRLDDAESVYREAVRRFPDNPVARNGLAEVLKAQGRLDDAESVYRESVHRFPDNPVARTGLGDVLRAQGRLDEAEAMYRKVLDRGWNEAAEVGLGHVQRIRLGSEVAEPETPYLAAELTPLQSDDVEILIQDAFLLRHWARDREPGERRSRARELLERLTTAAATDAAVAGERGLLALDFADLDETLDLLRRAADRFPGSARVRYALARAEQAAAVRDADASPEHLRPWKKLSRLDGRLRPVQLLGEARTLLARPGAQDEVRDHFGELGNWIERTLAHAAENGKGTDFNVAWARELRGHLFGDRAYARAEDINDLDAVCANLKSRDDKIAYQEETYLARVTVT